MTVIALYIALIALNDDSFDKEHHKFDLREP